MDAGGCQRTLASALRRECGVENRKNMDCLFGVVDSKRSAAVDNATRLLRHHEAIGNVKSSSMNPATRIADIFGEFGPYLEKGRG